MESEELNEKDLEELYENYDYSNEYSNVKKKRIIPIPMLILLFLGILAYSLGYNKTLGDILNIDRYSSKVKSIDESSKKDIIELTDISSSDIENRLKNGDLLGDIVKDYFKSEYNLDVTVVDIVDVTEDLASDDILKLITVKDSVDGSAYEFRYYRSNDISSISDTYSSTLTSKLLGEKLTEYFKNSLPKGSVIWVDSESLGLHSDVFNSSISDVIEKASIEDLLKYTDEVNLFKGIGINIVENNDFLLNNDYTKKDYVLEYKDLFLDIAYLLEKANIYPNLEVAIFKGVNGKNSVFSYLEQKIGLTTVGGNFFIDWYSEIPMMGEEAKNNIIGAISIKSNIVNVINDYVTNGTSMYLDKTSDTYKPIYSSVEDIMQSSVVSEQMNLSRILN